jgi:hypothetical protein
VVKRRRLALAVLLLWAGALLACSAIWGFDSLTPLPADASTDTRPDVSKPEAGPADAGDAAEEVVRKESGVEAACVPAVPPKAPAADDDGGADADLIFALHALDLGTKLSDPVGYDLDTVCTCPGPSSCTLPSSAVDGEACDHPGGRDNATGALFADLGTFDPHLDQSNLNSEIENGKFTVLVRVRNYNGLANDTNVDAEFYNSPGSNGPPRWTGSDSWFIYKDNVLSGTDESNYVPVYYDTHAYVRDYTLVARPRTLAIRIAPDTGINDNYLEFPISSSVVTLDLQTGDGLFAARLASSDLLSSVQVLESDAGFLCGTNILYLGIASEVCPAQDIMTSPSEDNAGKSCDALSLAIGFTSVAAHLDMLESPVQVEASCPPGWNPSCDM